MSIVPSVVVSIVLFDVVRAIVSLFQSPSISLYRAFSPQAAGFGGETIMDILGAEPFLLAAGGLLLISAGVKQAKLRTTDEGGSEVASSSSQT